MEGIVFITFVVGLILYVYFTDRKKRKIRESYHEGYMKAILTNDKQLIQERGREWIVSGYCTSDNKKTLYNDALRMLESDATIRLWALETGRAYYASLRKGGVVTIYDETAIKNDISVRIN